MNREPSATSSNAALVRETKKVKRLWSSLTVLPTSLDRVLAELNQTSFVLVKLQAKLRKPRMEFLQTRRCFIVVLKADHKSSSPGESHPEALTEPDVNLSAHPALIVQSQDEFQFAKAQTSWVLGVQCCLTSEPLVVHDEQNV